MSGTRSIPGATRNWKFRLSALTEGAQFYLDIWDDCMNRVDTSMIGGSCLFVTDTEPFAVDTLTGLSGEPTDYYIRVTTRLTSDAPGDFWFQIVGDDFFSSVSEPDFASFRFFPNPATDRVTTSFGLKSDARVQVGIYNTLGQMIYQEDKGKLAQGEHTLQHPLSSLPPGIYFFNIRVDSQLKRRAIYKRVSITFQGKSRHLMRLFLYITAFQAFQLCESGRFFLSSFPFYCSTPAAIRPNPHPRWILRN